MSEAAVDTLLTWASEVGGGTWEAWKEACDDLEVDASRSASALSQLGHVEFDWEGDRFCVAPTTAVLIPRSSGSVIVTGSRPAGLLGRLREITEDGDSEFDVYFHEVIRQSNGPETWLIEAQMSDVEAFCAATGMRFEQESGRRIIEMTPRALLSELGVPEEVDGRYLRRWFDPGSRRLKYRCPDPAGGGLWLVSEWRRDAAFVVKDRRSYRIPIREFGSYLAYPNAGFLEFNRTRETLDVDAAAPLPPLLARGAALQTGRLPEEIGGRLRYWNVDAELAATIANKLSHSLVIS